MNNLLTFVKTRKREGDFGRFVDVAGNGTSYGVAIEILSWLKRQKRFRHDKDLELNPDHTWCQQLPVLLETDPSLARLFEIVNGRMRFRTEIDLAERSHLRELADAEYQPEIRV